MAEAVVDAERIRLVPFCEEFLSGDYVAWLNDKELMRYSEQRHREHTLASCRAYLESFRGTPNYFWAVVRREDGAHIGNLNVYVDVNNSTADMGLLIGRADAAGRGYGLEAWTVAMGFLIDELGLRKVTGGAMSDNKAMVKIMRRSGMEPDGVRKRQFLRRGGEVDAEYWCLFA